MGAVYDELPSLTASTILHSGSEQFFPHTDIIDAEDSGTTDDNECPEHGLSGPEIIAKLKGLTPEDESLITKFKDPPLFLFSSIPGKYGPVTVFYDTGNSHCLFCKGTPENLYGVSRRHYTVGQQQLGHHAPHHQG